MRTILNTASFRLSLAALSIAIVQAQDGSQVIPKLETPENFSPLGYYDLRAFEQAYPETPMHPLFRQDDRKH